MDNSIYANLSRQIALTHELSTIANNIANASTTGFRREGVIFSEFVQEGDSPLGSLSLGAARTRFVDTAQGALEKTEGVFDVGIEGEGFFQIQTPNGVRLTRFGAFTPNAEGLLSTTTGHLVLDAGGGPIFIPPDAASISIAADGAVSADGQLVAQMGAVAPIDPRGLRREADGLLTADVAVAPADGAKFLQGFLEGSNVDPILEITRMIEVQRAYELSQNLADIENDRITSAVSTMGRPL